MPSMESTFKLYTDTVPHDHTQDNIQESTTSLIIPKTEVTVQSEFETEMGIGSQRLG